jgi:predicted dehydrogenase
MSRTVSLGVIGLGSRGEALARALHDLPGADLRWLCDLDPRIRLAARRRFAPVEFTSEVDDLLGDATLDAVVIATPASSHAALVQHALEAGKHVLVEPPLALTAAEADRLLAETERRDRCLMVGHSILFQPAVRKVKELIDLGRLGDVYYLYANHQTLGRVRRDENVLWNLGPQEISALLYLLEDEPLEVSAQGAAYLQRGLEDVVYCHLRFRGGISAHLHLSWLDPHTTRQLAVVGSKRMAVVDDVASDRKLTIFGGTAQAPREGGAGEVRVRPGDVISPRIGCEPPLELECEHFLVSIRSQHHALANPGRAASVVRILESLQRSLTRGGLPEPVGNTPAANGNVTPLVRPARLGSGAS